MEIDLSRPTRGQEHRRGEVIDQAAVPGVIDLNADAAALAVFSTGEEPKRDLVFVEGNVRFGADRVQESAFNFASSQVFGMNNSPVSVTAFAAQLEIAGRFVASEFRAPLEQLANHFRPFLHQDLDDVLFTQARPRDERVLDVRSEGVVFAQDTGNPSLGMIRVGIERFLFGHHLDRARVRRQKGEHQARDSASDNQIIRLDDIDFRIHGAS